MDALARILFNRFTAFALGLVFLASSFVFWTSAGTVTEVSCDGRRMSPGDTCIHSDMQNPENNRTNNYDEELAEQQHNKDLGKTVFSIVCPILAVGTLGGSIAVIVRRRRRSQVAVPPTVSS